MSKRAHKIDPDSFCYICAQFISGTKRKLTTILREAYWKCFKSNCADIESNFTPSYICSSCQRNLYRYNKNNAHYMPFTCPAIWSKSSSHDKGICYYCSIDKPSLNRQSQYFDCASCQIPKVDLPDLGDRPYVQSTSSDTQSSEHENDCLYEETNREPFEWSADLFNDFCKELNLSKIMSKKCLAMLKKDQDLKKKLSVVTVRHINDRSNDVKAFLSQSEDFSFCHDIEGLMGYLCVSYNKNDWCLFVDSSSTSLKAALMYKNNLYPTIPIAYGNVKEDRNAIQKILELINYNCHGWLIMSDLKVLNFIMGLKSGYAKYPCFYCMFDSRQSQLDFDPLHIWPTRVDFHMDPLVPLENIAFPFLHIKLGLFQKFVKTLDKGSDCFQFIRKNIKKSEAKLMNGVFTGPEIRFLMKQADFPGTMTTTQCEAWFNFIAVAKNVLGKDITADWKEKIDRLISSYQAMGCPTVSSKMHLLYKHKDKCNPYIGIFSDEHGERLHKEMQVIEKRFKQCLNKEMLAECIWSLKRATNFYKSTRNVY